MRLKWMRQFVMITPNGLLRISSASFYDRCEYLLAGAQAVIIEPASGSESSAPEFKIRLAPALQTEGTIMVTFRLLSADDLGPWTRALSRCFSLNHMLARRAGAACIRTAQR